MYMHAVLKERNAVQTTSILVYTRFVKVAKKVPFCPSQIFYMLLYDHWSSFWYLT